MALTPEEVAIINELTYAVVAQRDVVLCLAQALAMQPSIDVTKLRADFLLAGDRLFEKKGLDAAHREELKMLDACLRLGAIRRDPPLSLEPLPGMT